MPNSNALNTQLLGDSGTGSITGTISAILVTPNLGTPATGTLTNCTALPMTTGVTGTLSVTNGGTGLSDPAADNVLLTNGASALATVTLTDGQLVVGSTGATPVAAAITGGNNITVTNGTGSITIDASGHAGFLWNEETGTTVSMVPDNGYIANNAAQVSLTLPVSAAVGTRIGIIGEGAGGWSVLQNASQLIRIGSKVSATGVAGTISSTNRYDAIDLICTVTDTQWTASTGPQGNITIL